MSDLRHVAATSPGPTGAGHFGPSVLAPDPVADVAARLAAGAETSTQADATAAAVAALHETRGVEGVVLERLCHGFGLSAFERDLWVLAALPEEHEAFAELVRSCHPYGEARVSAALAARVLGLDAAGRRHLRRALTTGPLVKSGLLVCGGPVPASEQSLVPADSLWDVVRGGDSWPTGVTPRAVTGPADDRFPSADLVAALDGGARLVVVEGGRGRPAEDLAAHVLAAAEQDGRLVVVLRSGDVPGAAARAVECHLVARGALPVVVGVGDAPPLPHYPAAVVVCLEPGTEALLDDRPAVEVRVESRTLGDELAMWHRLAPELNGDAARLAGLLRVDGPRATRVVADARLAAQTRRQPVDVDEIVHRARTRSDARLPASVRRSTPTVPRDRLVTTTDNDALLRALVGRVRGQVRVLHDWGFGEIGGVRGARALLSGPPGTGKTLATQVIATQLGLDLLTVDLSALVSKWLGETEKNIGEVFDAAERCQAVLFFDEADAIFGRRTDAGDAQARWANLETAYLLSRVDSFDGLVVLATNLRGNLDEAFMRRLDVVVEFDEPGPDERCLLWRCHLPARAPVAEDVDVEMLAELYPVSGGVIRNVVLCAAYHAAEHGGPITQSMILDCVRREYQKSGRSFPGVPRSLTVPSGGV